MTTYTIKNSAGTTVTSIPPLTTTGSTFPIEMVGDGISPYGEYIATIQYHLLENFSNSTAPSNPTSGMLWHNPSNKVMSFYDSGFIPLVSNRTTYASKFEMDSAATGVNFATTGTTTIFTNPNQGLTFYPTAIMLTTSATPTATDPAVFNVYVTSSEDVLETSIVSMTSTDQYAFFNIQGTTMSVSGSNSVKIEVTSAPSSGVLTLDVTLFGYTR